LEHKPTELQTYYNAARSHAALAGHVPLTFAAGLTPSPIDLNRAAGPLIVVVSSSSGGSVIRIQDRYLTNLRIDVHDGEQEVARLIGALITTEGDIVVSELLLNLPECQGRHSLARGPLPHRVDEPLCVGVFPSNAAAIPMPTRVPAQRFDARTE